MQLSALPLIQPKEPTLMFQWFSHLCRSYLLALVATLCLLPIQAHAASYVSVKGATVNVRAQPSTRAAVQWQLDRGYPLRVLQKKGKWLQVADYEATLGWLFAPLTSTTPHRIVTAPKARLRAGPGTRHRILTTLQQGEILRTLETRKGWALVRIASGTQGWIARSLTWGW